MFPKQQNIKPKLPRKRKKACIKAQGSKSYWDTVKLARVTGEFPCKFWVNSTVVFEPALVNGQVIMMPRPKRYW